MTLPPHAAPVPAGGPGLPGLQAHRRPVRRDARRQDAAGHPRRAQGRREARHRAVPGHRVPMWRKRSSRLVSGADGRALLRSACACPTRRRCSSRRDPRADVGRRDHRRGALRRQPGRAAHEDDLRQGRPRWKCGHLWPLSGTPAPKHAGSLWPLLFAAGVVGMDYDAFLKRYCRIDFLSQRPVGTKEEHIPELRALWQQVGIRRTKKQVAPDMPDIGFDFLQVEPEKKVDLADPGRCRTSAARSMEKRTPTSTATTASPSRTPRRAAARGSGVRPRQRSPQADRDLRLAHRRPAARDASLQGDGLQAEILYGEHVAGEARRDSGEVPRWPDRRRGGPDPRLRHGHRLERREPRLHPRARLGSGQQPAGGEPPRRHRQGREGDDRHRDDARQRGRSRAARAHAPRSRIECANLIVCTVNNLAYTDSSQGEGSMGVQVHSRSTASTKQSSRSARW
jgi:hypothetical protein